MEIKKTGNEHSSDYETVGKIWGDKVKILISTEGEKKCPLDTIIPRIERILAMIPRRDETAEILKRDGIIDRAEEWVAECEPADDYSDDHERFVLDKGVIIELPITVEQFAESLKVDSLGVSFMDSADDFTARLYLYCKPDYFDGHSIEVSIDKDGEMRCLGICG